MEQANWVTFFTNLPQNRKSKSHSLKICEIDAAGLLNVVANHRQDLKRIGPLSANLTKWSNTLK